MMCGFENCNIKILLQTEIFFGVTTNTHQTICSHCKEKNHCKDRNDKSF